MVDNEYARGGENVMVLSSSHMRAKNRGARQLYIFSLPPPTARSDEKGRAAPGLLTRGKHPR